MIQLIDLISLHNNVYSVLMLIEIKDRISVRSNVLRSHIPSSKKRRVYKKQREVAYFE